jgi:hypothetical protein
VAALAGRILEIKASPSAYPETQTDEEGYGEEQGGECARFDGFPRNLTALPDFFFADIQ